MKLGNAELDALREMFRWWPERQEKRLWNVNLRTVQALERKGLAEYRAFTDNHDWPPRPSRPSDQTWEAWLTPEGEQEALRRGYAVHAAENCEWKKLHRGDLDHCPLHRAVDPLTPPVLAQNEEKDA